MEFRVGDPVVHWMYGLGQVVRLEKKDVSGTISLYYAVQVRGLTVWVPADDKVGHRLRMPLSESAFKKLIAILSRPSEPLPDDSRERRLHIQELLKDGRAETLCRAIRDLAAAQRGKTMNEYDQSLMRRMQTVLLGEWGLVLSISPENAALELNRLLGSPSKR
jgi:RNA polymerase-interacting CarD/CdnL/TRCF family regulator